MKPIYGFGLAILGAIAWFYMSNVLEVRRFASSRESFTALMPALYGYAMTVIGVVLGSAYRALSDLRDQEIRMIRSFRKLSRTIFRSVEFWMALLASPIVYAALWKTIDSNNLAALTVFPLENGFACLAIIGAIVAKHSPQSQ